MKASYFFFTLFFYHITSFAQPIMALVQGGTFNMGTITSEDIDEKPMHSVTLHSYLLGKYEVTQKEWTEIMNNNPSYHTNCDDCPVEMVSWDDVQQYISKLNQKTGKTYRLPTEAEWEFAARGGNNGHNYTYSGGENLQALGWYYENSKSTTMPAGRKQPNELGIFDMTGNVNEWCSDYYDPLYYNNSPENNPHGPDTGNGRVIRGGCFSDLAEYCTNTARNNDSSGRKKAVTGFRLAMSVKE